MKRIIFTRLFTTRCATRFCGVWLTHKIDKQFYVGFYQVSCSDMKRIIFTELFTTRCATGCSDSNIMANGLCLLTSHLLRSTNDYVENIQEKK